MVSAADAHFKTTEWRSVSKNQAKTPRQQEEASSRTRTKSQRPPQPTPASSNPPLTLERQDVRRVLCAANPRKSAGPDGVPGTVLKACAEQLAQVFTDIFNLSLEQAVIPPYLKSTIISPISKKSPITSLNDFRPIALNIVKYS